MADWDIRFSKVLTAFIGLLLVSYWINVPTAKSSVGVQNHTTADDNMQELLDAFSELCWVAYSASTFDPTQNPIAWPTRDDIRHDFQVLRSVGFEGLVTYGTRSLDPNNLNQIIDMPKLAQEEGFQGIVVGVWDPNDEDELRMAEEVSQHEIVLGYSVGNEGLDSRYSFEALSRAIERLRARTGKPVTTTEELGDYRNNEALITIGDWIFPNVHPYFANLHYYEWAAEWTGEIFDDFEARFDQPVIFKEVGLPSAGDWELSEENQALYYQALRDSHVNYIVFEAFDSPWKGIPYSADSPEPLPNPEPYWGVFTQNREPKEVAETVCER